MNKKDAIKILERQRDKVDDITINKDSIFISQTASI
jgi:hypothetical protein